ncbi:hypothetical protein [Photorhabdus sp. RM71S]|uniref:hypothetical protein n=1 Tax=Photorhabdus sp. RM71S TaxID=3342824 RepID=UPI0036DB7969
MSLKQFERIRIGINFDKSDVYERNLRIHEQWEAELKQEIKATGSLGMPVRVVQRRLSTRE